MRTIRTTGQNDCILDKTYTTRDSLKSRPRVLLSVFRCAYYGEIN